MTKKKTTASERYWEKRRGLEDKARLKLEKKTLNELESVFERALVKIQRQLLSQADLHDITQSEMLEDFSKRDQEKYRKYIEKNYEKLMESDEAYKQFIDEYFPSFDYAKVNRLLQLRADIFSTLAGEAISSDVNGKFNNDLENITKRIYNSNSNTLMQLLGGSAPGLSKKELENILNYPWSGKTFSSRLWGNISSLEQRLSNSIINSLASGEGVLEALRTMKNDGVVSGMFKLEQGKFNRSIENLVRTEYSHFAVEGVRKSLKDVGIKQTQSWSAEDERVCSICGRRHGKEIKDDWHPPYHGRCRCTEIPMVPEISDDIDKLYEEMFGDLLDEFASKQWGIKLNHPKSTTIANRFSLSKLTEENIGDTERINDIINRTKDVISNYKNETGIDVIKLFEDKKFADKNNPYTDEKSKFIRYLLKNNGFDGLPQKVTDVDDLIPVYRGIVDFKYGDDTSQEQIDRFLRSHFDISGARSSANGRGSYFTSAKFKAQEYANNGNNGQLITAYLLEKINLLDDSIFLKEREAFRKIADNFGEDAKYYAFLLSKNFLMDTQKDIYALISGYDGIQKGAIYNILNRTMLGVKK
ncbi:head protein [Enterococcus faecalis]|mgnify:FL=1|jgi:SPP1 gp7 family putative phage head morphogenesis protein|uniref:head protein n=1 Tax=Enterococcus TaxID=1350 RepID=UPI00053BEEED|nr:MULTISPECIES: head protein [Enterococcus]HAP4941598.1 head protein [Enterococcus faecalis ADL-123]EGO8292527.1 head protein [Enterococcus faecalis]EGO9346855.1 head protein [Enterococcus faecalis]EHQ2623913.1 head protein [Enterococcus faecalis]EIW2162676.1 head protein [Enterococcus faecalis]